MDNNPDLHDELKPSYIDLLRIFLSSKERAY